MITKKEATDWLQNWCDYIAPAYVSHGMRPPESVYIPMQDLEKILEFARDHVDPMYEVKGVRAYFALKTPPKPNTPADDITVVLIPAGIPIQGPVTDSCPQDLYHQTDYHDDLAIYDVVSPCPKCCGDLYLKLGVEPPTIGADAP